MGSPKRHSGVLNHQVKEAWQTPTAKDSQPGRVEDWKSGKGEHRRLRNQAQVWPTPYGFMGDAGNPRYGGGGEFAKFVKKHTQWPTPTAISPNEGESLEAWEARRRLNLEKGINGNGQGTPLGVAVRMWPTAQVHDAQGKRGNTMDDNHHYPHDLHNAVMEHDWPTPDASRGGAETTNRKQELGRRRSGSGNLKGMAGSAKLSPRWGETLMGVPIGWCLPSCTCPLTPVSTS